MRAIVAAILLLAASVAWAEARPEDGGREIQLWTGGGHSVAGGTGKTSVWNLGLRYGWILTRPHGPGLLKGRFEYAGVGVPAFLGVQRVRSGSIVGQRQPFDALIPRNESPLSRRIVSTARAPLRVKLVVSGY